MGNYSNIIDGNENKHIILKIVLKIFTQKRMVNNNGPIFLVHRGFVYSKSC